VVLYEDLVVDELFRFTALRESGLHIPEAGLKQNQYNPKPGIRSPKPEIRNPKS